MRTIYVSIVALCIGSAAFATNKQPVPEWAVNNSAKAEAQSHSSANAGAVAIGKNDNRNTNVVKGGDNQNKNQNNNINVSRGGDGGKGGNATATGGKGGKANANSNQRQRQSQNASSRNTVSNNVKIEGDDYEAGAASAMAYAADPTGRCLKTMGVGYQLPGAGASLSLSSESKECWKREDCDAIAFLVGPEAGAICYAHISVTVHQTLTSMGIIRAE